jgi:hypothetical protein
MKKKKLFMVEKIKLASAALIGALIFVKLNR